MNINKISKKIEKERRKLRVLIEMQKIFNEKEKMIIYKIKKLEDLICTKL